MRKERKASLLVVLLLLALGAALPAQAETSLLPKYQAMVAENPDLDVEITLTGTFQFDEGEDDISLLTRCHYTHEPLAFFTQVGFHTFASGQEAKTVCMLYDGDFVMYAWNDEPGGKRIKQKTTRDALVEMLKGPPIVSYLAGVARAYESAASIDGASATIWLTPEEAEQFLQESGLSLGNIMIQANAAEPVALLYQFESQGEQISTIQFSCPTVYEYQGMRVEGSISLQVRFLQIGQVSPIEMPKEAATAPFS